MWLFIDDETFWANLGYNFCWSRKTEPLVREALSTGWRRSLNRYHHSSYWSWALPPSLVPNHRKFDFLRRHDKCRVFLTAFEFHSAAPWGLNRTQGLNRPPLVGRSRFLLPIKFPTFHWLSQVGNTWRTWEPKNRARAPLFVVILDNKNISLSKLNSA